MLLLLLDIASGRNVGLELKKHKPPRVFEIPGIWRPFGNFFLYFFASFQRPCNNFMTMHYMRR